jgi:hypothetical protein
MIQIMRQNQTLIKKIFKIKEGKEIPLKKQRVIVSLMHITSRKENLKDNLKKDNI